MRGWTQSFARTRVRPERAGTMARGGDVVKRWADGQMGGWADGRSLTYRKAIRRTDR